MTEGATAGTAAVAGATGSGAHGKRRALLDAALALFLEHGVVETTLEDLLARSGASVGSLYHHFGGKEQVADALYVECLSTYQRVALDTLHNTRSNEAGVRSLVEHQLFWITEHADESRFVLAYRDHEFRHAADELRSLNRVFYGELEHWITPRAARPLPPLSVVISVWIGPARSFSRHYLTGNAHCTIDEARDFLSDSAWHALAPLFRPPAKARPQRH